MGGTGCCAPMLPSTSLMGSFDDSVIRRHRLQQIFRPSNTSDVELSFFLMSQLQQSVV